MEQGGYIQFVSLSAGQNFTLPLGFKTASICPVGTGSAYTVAVIGAIPPAPVSPALLDITSFPQIDTWQNWYEHLITCTVGTVIIKYFASQINL